MTLSLHVRRLVLLITTALVLPIKALAMIPRQLYVSVAGKDEAPPLKLHRMYERERAAGWTVKFVDNVNKTAFVEKHFANTTFLWAYRNISPRLGVAMADMWRLAVLWKEGGVYIDSDGYLETPLDEIIRRNNGSSLILTKERNVQEECYREWHPLSRKRLQTLNPPLYASIASVYSNAVISSWCIFAAPGHPILLRAMRNIAALVRAEFNHHSALDAQSRGAGHFLWNRGRMILCLTGPMLLTRTIYQHQLLLNVSLPLFSPELSVGNADFKIYGGNAKVTSNNRGNQNYYLHTLQNPRALFLSSYAATANSTKSPSLYDEILQQRSYGRPPPAPAGSRRGPAESTQTRMADLEPLLRMLEDGVPYALAGLGPGELSALDGCADAARDVQAAGNSWQRCSRGLGDALRRALSLASSSNHTYVGIPCACDQSGPHFARALQLLNITLLSPPPPPPPSSFPSSTCPNAPPALDFRHALVPPGRLTAASLLFHGNYWLAHSELARVLNQRVRQSGRAVFVFAGNNSDPAELPFPSTPTLLSSVDAFEAHYPTMRASGYLASRGVGSGDIVLLMLGPLGRVLACEWTRILPSATFLSLGSFYDQFAWGRLDRNAAKGAACMFTGDVVAGNLGTTRDPLPDHRSDHPHPHRFKSSLSIV